jgi:hypothetical protein
MGAKIGTVVEFTLPRLCNPLRSCYRSTGFPFPEMMADIQHVLNTMLWMVTGREATQDYSMQTCGCDCI